MQDNWNLASLRRSNPRYSLLVGFSLSILFFAASGIVAYRNASIVRANTENVKSAHDLLLDLSQLLGLVLNAETGQRGFVITGNETYLQPYSEAIGLMNAKVVDIEKAAKTRAHLEDSIPAVRANISAKLGELASVIEMRRDKGFEAARTAVATDVGEEEMDELRDLVLDMEAEENAASLRNTVEMNASLRGLIVTGLFSALLGVVLTVAIALILHRSAEQRQRQQWIQDGQIGLAKALAGEQGIAQLGENVLKFLANYIDAQAGAFFGREGSAFSRTATYGVPADATMPKSVKPGDGLLAQAAHDGRTFIINDVPENYLTVGSALGQGTPRHLAIAPAMIEGTAVAAFELGFLQAPSKPVIALLETVSELLGPRPIS